MDGAASDSRRASFSLSNTIKSALFFFDFKLPLNIKMLLHTNSFIESMFIYKLIGTHILVNPPLKDYVDGLREGKLKLRLILYISLVIQSSIVLHKENQLYEVHQLLKVRTRKFSLPNSRLLQITQIFVGYISE